MLHLNFHNICWQMVIISNGRKYAALSLRFKDKNPFYLAMKENYE